EELPRFPVELAAGVGATVHEGAHGAAEAHRETLRMRRELEAHALAAVGEVRRGADHPLVVSHRCSSGTVETRAFAGRVARRSPWCAPYDTATASTSLLASSSRSWVVSPTIRASAGSTPVSSRSVRSIPGWGLAKPSSAQRVA